MPQYSRSRGDRKASGVVWTFVHALFLGQKGQDGKDEVHHARHHGESHSAVEKQVPEAHKWALDRCGHQHTNHCACRQTERHSDALPTIPHWIKLHAYAPQCNGALLYPCNCIQARLNGPWLPSTAACQTGRKCHITEAAHTRA